MHLIVNPAAAGGRVGKQWPKLYDRLRRADVDCHFTFTLAPGHATELTAALVAEGESAVVAVGGDGTICEIVEGLRPEGDTSLGVLPMGTGNDAARTLGIPLDIDGAIAALKDGATRKVDLMEIGDHTVLNAIGIGLLGAININSTGIKFVRGIAAYLVAAAVTLFRYRALPIELSNDDFAYRGGMLILAIHNGPTTGGGFCLTPAAVPDDGVLDCCLVGPVGLPGRLSRLGSALRGTLTDRKGSYPIQFRELELKTAERLPAHFDGNPGWIEPPGVRIVVRPLALTIIAPAPISPQ